MLAVEFLTWRASLYNSLSSPVFKLVLARRRTGSMMLQFQINAAAKLLRLRQPVPGTIAVSPDELTATFTTDCSAQSFHQLLYGSYGWDSGPGRPASAVRLYRLLYGSGSQHNSADSGTGESGERRFGSGGESASGSGGKRSGERGQRRQQCNHCSNRRNAGSRSHQSEQRSQHFDLCAFEPAEC